MGTATAAPTQDNTKATIAYILTWLTGLIVLLIADKTDKNTRWHAIQAIGLGIALMVASMVFNLVGGLLWFVGGGFPWLWGPGPLPGLVWLGGLVVAVLLAVKAYHGEKVRLPWLADIADTYA